MAGSVFLPGSLPTRGAWIEIGTVRYSAESEIRRSPHGERGLKYLVGAPYVMKPQALPTRGAWIEIQFRGRGPRRRVPSLPTRRAWIEIGTSMRMAYSLRSRSPHGERGLKLLLVCHRRKKARSLPTRGAWIEIRSWLLFRVGVI